MCHDEFYFIPDASYKIFRMSDINGPSPGVKYIPIPTSRRYYDCANSGMRCSFSPYHPRPSSRLYFFLSDPVKDDSAENGMPLAFLISAFCRPLSANGRDRAITTADSAARSATRNIRGENIHTQSHSVFLDFSGCPLCFSRYPRGKNYSVPKRDASRVITRNTPLELQSRPCPCRYSCPRLNLSYFYVDNKIIIDFVCRCNYLLYDAIPSHLHLISWSLHYICVG